MRRYETIFIIDPDLQDKERESLTGKLDELISQQGGTLLKIDDWGQRRLAYEIKKRPRGHYILLDYCGTGTLVEEMERLFRIDDSILKYMTVLLEKSVDIKAAKEQIAHEEAEKERISNEKAKANLKAANAAANESDTATDSAKEAPPQKKPATDQNTTDVSEATSEPENEPVTEDSGNKEE